MVTMAGINLIDCFKFVEVSYHSLAFFISNGNLHVFGIFLLEILLLHTITLNLLFCILSIVYNAEFVLETLQVTVLIQFPQTMLLLSFSITVCTYVLLRTLNMNMFLFCTFSSGTYVSETNHYYYTGFRKQARYPAEEKSVVGSYDKLCEIEEEERITVRQKQARESGYTGLSILHRLHALYGFEYDCHMVYDELHGISLNAVKNHIASLKGSEEESIDWKEVDSQLKKVPWTHGNVISALYMYVKYCICGRFYSNFKSLYRLSLFLKWHYKCLSSRYLLFGVIKMSGFFGHCKSVLKNNYNIVSFYVEFRASRIPQGISSRCGYWKGICFSKVISFLYYSS